ncbi:hypothetical protein GY45DRAFT_985409 [Cubamyces sp. BRFM 1775]|nr:hypothetical protein GY45DRAFT_985409 [Cubamyces sp. BRFM 1775]
MRSRRARFSVAVHMKPAIGLAVWLPFAGNLLRGEQASGTGSSSLEFLGHLPLRGGLGVVSLLICGRLHRYMYGSKPGSKAVIACCGDYERSASQGRQRLSVDCYGSPDETMQ